MSPRKKTFQAFYDVDPVTGCWIWNGMKNATGYGRCRPEGRTKVFAHRRSFELHKGPIPDGALVCHACDTPSCVNPGHLYIGTPADNMRDRTDRGRARNQNTGRTHCSRGHLLTDDNLYKDKRWNGRGKCKICTKDAASARYARRCT